MSVEYMDMESNAIEQSTVRSEPIDAFRLDTANLLIHHDTHR